MVSLTDDQLLDAQRELAEIRRLVDSCASLVAGEISERSRRDLGYKGLAQRLGFRTPEALVQHTTGSTAREASTLVRVGTFVHDALSNPISPDGTPADESLPGPQERWLVAVAAAVASGALSLDAANAIRTGLGVPLLADSAGASEVGVSADALADAASTLLSESPTLNADQLLRRARQLRDELDEAGIALREQAIRDARSVRRVRRSNGLSRYIIDPDLESAAFWDDVYDKLTSPRRGGPRFVSEADLEWAEAIAADARSTEQYVHDAVTQLLRIAVASESTDSRKIIGSRQPAVRVLVTAKSLGSARRGRPDPQTEGRDLRRDRFQRHYPGRDVHEMLKPAADDAQKPGVTVNCGREPDPNANTNTNRGLSPGDDRGESLDCPGHGRIEGIDIPLTIESVERIACESGFVPIEFDDDGRALNLGREQRLFTTRQRIALAARDGGCRWTDCDRPPSWSEAHHVEHWLRDNGRTDLADGILLCRFHHMLLHNNRWDIYRNADGFWLVPPASIDPDRTPRLLPSTSAALRDLLQETAS
ncbi:MAG: HNH endonuclease [Microbacteriaceae bacterium]|nr:HNH endonuclease [Microbacteriaceae bacterium]